MKLLYEVVKQVFGGKPSEIGKLVPVGGGCINNTGIFVCQGKSYFLKWNTNAEDLFEKEERGLKTLKDANAVRVPTVLGRGKAIGMDFLCLEHIELGSSSQEYWRNLGQGLATLHRHHSNSYGLDFDNHIGRLPQSNKQHDSWEQFFVEERLMPQVKIARDAMKLDQGQMNLFELLYIRLEGQFPIEKPSLLHGDLWSGNIMCSVDNRAFIFDPAVYYGHREAELAFTTMFGGFDKMFYEAYQECFPLASNFDERIDIYNLYPLLVHLNLFGASYLSPILSTLRRFI